MGEYLLPLGIDVSLRDRFIIRQAYVYALSMTSTASFESRNALSIVRIELATLLLLPKCHRWSFLTFVRH